MRTYNIMVCKGKCHLIAGKYGIIKGSSPYLHHSFCVVCNVWFNKSKISLDTDMGTYVKKICPCCNYRLRNRTHHKDDSHLAKNRKVYV